MHGRTLFTPGLLLLGYGAQARAQAADSLTPLRRVTIIGDTPESPIRVRLTNVGAHVKIAGAPDFSADTLVASTPLTLLLPAGVFRLDVSSVTSNEKLFLVSASRRSSTDSGTFRSMFFAPVRVERVASTGSITISSKAMKSELVP